jgi:hypothetical protein
VGKLRDMLRNSLEAERACIACYLGGEAGLSPAEVIQAVGANAPPHLDRGYQKSQALDFSKVSTLS